MHAQRWLDLLCDTEYSQFLYVFMTVAKGLADEIAITSVFEVQF